MSSNVKFFRSTDTDAPAGIAQAAGAMIAVLDACLVNGYNSKTVTITRTGTTATVSCSSHGFADGRCVLISGAGQSEYNGEHYITYVDANSFTYTVADTAATPATGTISAKMAPAGWTKAFSGTNKAAYRMGGGNQRYLRVDDSSSGQYTGRLRGYEAMTDVDTGSGTNSGGFPLDAQVSGGLYFMRSTSTTARAWMVAATDTFVYVWLNGGGVASAGTSDFLWLFGDITARASGDQYSTVLIAASGGNSGAESNPASIATALNSALAGHYLARSYTGVGGSLQCQKQGDNSLAPTSYLGMAGYAYPNPIDGALLMGPIIISEPNVGIRGALPGLWNPLHNSPLSTYDTVTGSNELAGRKFISVSCRNGSSTGGQMLLEISNTWYS